MRTTEISRAEWVGVQGPLELGAGTVTSGTGLSLAGLRRSEVASGAGEGGQEATGPPAGPLGPEQVFGLHPDGPGELGKGL